mmetsp:Transcript_58896/g.140546  ORF Transcript_58896/g.140546 Transcript_58896/m.140546 type:complete len:249 (-) Transcript_58896:196-942(-)
MDRCLSNDLFAHILCSLTSRNCSLLHMLRDNGSMYCSLSRHLLPHLLCLLMDIQCCCLATMCYPSHAIHPGWKWSDTKLVTEFRSPAATVLAYQVIVSSLPVRQEVKDHLAEGNLIDRCVAEEDRTSVRTLGDKRRVCTHAIHTVNPLAAVNLKSNMVQATKLSSIEILRIRQIVDMQNASACQELRPWLKPCAIFIDIVGQSSLISSLQLRWNENCLSHGLQASFQKNIGLLLRRSLRKPVQDFRSS